MENFLVLMLSALVFNIQQVRTVSRTDVGKNFIYDRYPYGKVINVIVNSTTQQTLDFYEDNDLYCGYPSRVHVSCEDTINGTYPLFITAIQQKGVSSWEIPLVVQTSYSEMQFNNMARTLCPHDAGQNTTTENRPTIQITTSNPKNVSVDIKLRRVKDFYVEIDKEIQLTVTPSTPKYYYFSFDHNPWNASLSSGIIPKFNYSIPKSVILMIESDDDVCAVVSIQNNSCPVFDNEQDMLYQGNHLTMLTKGGITLTQSMFPVGFYIVFIVKESDSDCTGDSETAIPKGFNLDNLANEYQAMGGDGRVKNFRFRIVATVSYKEYVIECFALLALFALVALFSLVIRIPECRMEETQYIIVDSPPGPSTSVEEVDETVPIIHEDNTQAGNPDLEDSWNSSLPRILTLADLSKAPTQTLTSRSNRYFWIALTVAVVYALPVVQLLSTYQNMVFQTGNQDLCYYNFLCAHPLGFFSDFNHVYSNIGYVVLGLVFMMQVRARQMSVRRRELSRPDRPVGIPQHHGLFYSMGLALVMEGILSACYHLCPNKMNFQFDSSFMYVIAVLCMVKIYQNRHPDVNASAHTTFIILACIMALGVYGIVYPSVLFWVVITTIHLTTCFILTLNIYYIGRFKLDRDIPYKVWSALRSRGLRAFLPHYRARAVLLAIANVANWCLAGYGLYEHNKDFARHILAILMGNTIIYLLFYVIMKLVHKERLRIHTWLSLVLALVTWIFAARFFLDSNTKWSETPAQSRQRNRPCIIMQMADSHDAWHAASAAALYLSFNMLLTVDDAIQTLPRDQIPVF